MNSPSQVKHIRSGHCACACHSLEALSYGDDNSSVTASAKTPSESVGNLSAYTRPSMTTLHEMLHNQEWEGIQDAIRKDASVAMRRDDSISEDMWFDSGRRGKAVEDGVDVKYVGNIDNVFRGSNNVGPQNTTPASNEEGNASQMPLRYWVGDNHEPYSVSDANIKAKVDMQQDRTLLHSLCRTHLPSNDALIVQLSHGDSEGLKHLMGAVKTAAMLIKASHNIPEDVDGTNGDCVEEVARDGETADDNSYPECKDCPCYIYRQYCPKVYLPPVERQHPMILRPDHPPEETEMVEHKSVLTTTDKMGETPFHSLTSAGSCHIDLIKEIVKACRPLNDESNSDPESDRRPTVRDLIVTRNFHGCTPVHFLADGKNEESIRLLLEQCQSHATISDDRPHPTMIRDSEDDLPLHFAACNGAPSSLLHILTTSLGDPRSTLVRNYRGRLPIDDYINSYLDNFDEFRTEESSTDSDWEEEDESSSVSSNGSWINTESGTLQERDPLQERDLEKHILCHFGFLSSPLISCESGMWQPMWVLIQAALSARTYSGNTVQHGSDETQERDNMYAQLQPSELPIHAAVIATKYANFPALALIASMFRNDTHDRETYGRDNNQPLLEKDWYGNLPLHWACAFNGDVAHNDGTHGGPMNPMTNQCKAIVRWNTKFLPFTMIEYLLDREPTAARIPTRRGRLPLHLLVERGNAALNAHLLEYDTTKDGDGDACIRQPWDDIKLLLKECPEALVKPDPTCHLYPFQIAAASSNTSYASMSCTGPQAELLSLEITFRLIMEDPSLLCQIIEN